ncbi:uncharacterized protein LOC119665790 [Teleopsis dalmanni]|uniref:uncharacterized protein LOC119665790 n=1 Tax=Teleopsis dalmanni TaxID=139649 RepID=UPI0018CF3533|nr:uncharacterized protein LOC119665790 [Teleopsis dalmanni]
MPHRPVYREDKTTTKMCIVFDASSSDSEHGSLNKFLSPGENLLPNLVSILLRFRSKRIAMTADIEKAFLQIAIDQSDRDTHRFLWYDKMPSINEQLPNIVEMRMTRVTFGVTSSPFLLSAVIRKHLTSCKETFPATCEALLKSFYVDDLLISCHEVEEAKKIYFESKKIMSEFKLHRHKKMLCKRR